MKQVRTMKRNYQSVPFAPFGIFYLLLALLLWWFRAPNVDEPWMGGIAVALERYGAFFDLGHLRAGLWKLFFFGESYYLCLFVWMKLFGGSLLSARLMSIFMGLGSLFLVHKILNKKIAHQRLWGILLLLGGNYFFLLANTQIRSETWCLLATTFSLYQMYLWSNTKKSSNLFLAHLFLILATFGHFQAAFVGLAAWVFTLYHFQKEKNFAWLPFLAPYAISGAIYFSYLYLHKEPFLEWYDFYFGNAGDMAGHAGGMIGSAMARLAQGNWIESVIILGLIVAFGLGNLAAIYQYRKNTLLFLIGLYGLGAYASWLLTTTHVNDYHAAWLFFPFLSILSLAPSTPFYRLLFYGNYLLMLAFFAWGIQWTYSISTNDPRTDFNTDISYIQTALDSGAKTIHCPREVMWSFDFSEAIFDPQNYTNSIADVVVRDRLTEPADISGYHRHDGKRFVIFVKE